VLLSVVQGTRVDPAQTPRTVRCPSCGGPSLYHSSNPYRPFCGERCKNLDLGAWDSEAFRVPTEGPPPDSPFGDPRIQ